MKEVLIFALLILSTLAYIKPHQGCYQKVDVPDHIITPLKHISLQDLPTAHDWGNVSGVNYLTLSRNQHIPHYCGSCWAFAATSVISDRIKIKRKAQWPDINISPQVLESHGCNGGSDLLSYEWIARNNITDETCSIYQAQGWTNGLECSSMIKCQNCAPGKGCWAQEKGKIYTVKEYGKVQGEEAMMNEIYNRGPISCGVAVTQELLDYTGGILDDKTGAKDIDHVVSVVGWGEENGVKFWNVRNSWGTYWGEVGFFRIVRGVNNLAIEEECGWADPIDTWTTDERNETVSNEKTEYKPKFLSEEGCKIELTDESDGSDAPQPHEYLSPDDVPPHWDWRNVSNVNYMSWSVNQHIPVYCGSCWAQAALSSFADRINIMRKNAFPQMALAVQTIVNCDAGGTCNGGNPSKVYKFAFDHGVPEVTCQNYIARNPSRYDCSPIQNCMTCAPPPPGQLGETCSSVKKYPVWRAIHYGGVSGVTRMKAEIYARGPISCAIESTTKFHEYTGGIFEEHLDTIHDNHIIQVLGWGRDEKSGEEYWIGRNSWGTYWGEWGYFRIKMYKDNLGIEEACSWGVPKLTY